MSATKKTPDVISSSRRTYIDWLRGVAVLCMVEWHAIDAWTLDSVRGDAAFRTLAYIGGWAAPLFLFLAGLAIPLAAESHVRKGRSVREAAWALQKRGWQVLLLAHLFRLQSYLVNPWAVWDSIFKPDILNILGLGMVAAAFCWGQSSTRRGRLVWLLIPAAIVLILTPLSRAWGWPDLLPRRLEAYIRPNGGFGVFTLFPWIAYVFIGTAVGLWVAVSRTADADRRFHLHLAGIGLAAVVAGWWLPAPWSGVLTRSGGMLLTLVTAWIWMQRPGTAHWSPMVVFGQTSLFVYWIHVELAYGIFAEPIKRALTVPKSVLAYLIFTALLLWAASAWRRWKGPWIPPHLVAPAVGVALLVVGLVGPFAATLLAQDQWRPVVVRLPAGIPISSVTTCVTDTGEPALRPSTVVPGQSDAQCALTAVARCAIPGAEPVDIDLGSLCRGGMARVAPAPRSVVPVWQDQSPATIEWRGWEDGVTMLLARRTVDPATTARLPVAAPDRLLRVFRPGTSPVTMIVRAADMPFEDVTAEVPTVAPGGELFLFFDERERQAGTLTVAGQDTQLIGINGVTFLSLPGLPPGGYVLRFGTPDLPEGAPLQFVIRDGETTELAPRLPAVASERRISGVVTLNGAPLPRQLLEVVHTTTDDTVTVTTDDLGRYSLIVPVSGTYLVRVVTLWDFGHVDTQRDVDFGETRLDVDLSGANVRLIFLLNGGVPEDAVTFVIEGPQRFSGTVRTGMDVQQPTDLLAIPYGNYLVRASMPPGFVSDAVPLVIDGTPGPRVVTLDLREQRATLRVQDDGGGLVPGVRARAGAQILRLSETGNTFDVRQVSPGTTVTIRAPARVPACVTLAPDSETIVRLQARLAPLQVLVGPEPLRSPPGRVRLNDADGCTLPLEEFEWRRIEGGFEILNFPYDTPATLEYGSQTFTLRAPGPPAIIR